MYQVKFYNDAVGRLKADAFFKRNGYWWRKVDGKEERLYQISLVVAYKPPLGRWVNV